MLIRFYLTFLSVCFCFTSFAQVNFTRSWYYTIKDSPSIDLNTHHFKPLAKDYQIPYLHDNGVYWFKLDIQNKNPKKDLIISVANPHLDSVFLYLPKENVFFPVDSSGNNYKLKDSTYLRFTRFRIRGNVSAILLKTRLKKDAIFPVQILTASNFNKQEHLNFFWLGLYYGFVLMVLAINISLYFSFRDLKFLYYALFLFLIALTFAFSDGLFVLMSRHAIWLNHGDLPVHLAVAIAGATFATNFLELNQNYPRLRWIGVTLAMLMATCYLLHLMIGGTYSYFAGDMLGLVLVGIYWLVGLFRFKTDVFARFFVLAYGVLLVFAFDFFFFRKLGWPFLNLSQGELKVASIMEMIILNMAIIYRVKKLQKANSHYRREILRFIKEDEQLREEPIQENTTERINPSLQEAFNLSEREIEVLALIGKGLTNAEIGSKLFLSANTVKFHVRNIYFKMDISNRAQAVNRLHNYKHK